MSIVVHCTLLLRTTVLPPSVSPNQQAINQTGSWLVLDLAPPVALMTHDKFRFPPVLPILSIHETSVYMWIYLWITLYTVIFQKSTPHKFQGTWHPVVHYLLAGSNFLWISGWILFPTACKQQQLASWPFTFPPCAHPIQEMLHHPRCQLFLRQYIRSANFQCLHFWLKKRKVVRKENSTTCGLNIT